MFLLVGTGLLAQSVSLRAVLCGVARDRTKSSKHAATHCSDLLRIQLIASCKAESIATSRLGRLD